MKNRRYTVTDRPKITAKTILPNLTSLQRKTQNLLFITTYPPRQCGIASYSQDLIESITRTYDGVFDIEICALVNKKHHYGDKVSYVLRRVTQIHT